MLVLFYSYIEQNIDSANSVTQKEVFDDLNKMFDFLFHNKKIFPFKMRQAIRFMCEYGFTNFFLTGENITIHLIKEVED